MDKQPKWMTITGWVLTTLASLMLVFSATMKFVGGAQFDEQFVGKFGYAAEAAIPIAVVELLCVAFYLFPRTAVLGAVLLTGYLGGATATHARVHDPFIPPIIFGVVVWLGLFFRERRVRAILPWMPAEPKT
jgi:hypothetical protein